MESTAVPRSWTRKLLWTTLVRFPLGAIVVAWLVSYAHSGALHWSPAAETSYFLGSQRGYVEIARQSITPSVPNGPYWMETSRLGRIKINSNDRGSASMSFSPRPYDHRFLGFGKSTFNGMFTLEIAPAPFRATATIYAIPYWALALVASIPPVVTLVRVRRTRGRAARGQCAHCGYDLRATPGRCPECGAEAATTSRASTAAAVEQ